jgi:hypothetical protein
VGLNPATGDSDGKPRPTLRKMVTWSHRWGGGGIIIVNLFGYRATQPRDLYRAVAAGIDIVGSGNDQALLEATSSAQLTVAAWGAHGRLQGRGAAVTSILHDPVCLGVTRVGEPRHPLYVPSSTEPIDYAHPLPVTRSP